MHDNDPDPKLLAYQYLQTLPQLAQGAGNTFWVIPSEVTTALRSVASAFGGGDAAPAASTEPATSRTRREPAAVPAARAALGDAPALEPGSDGAPLPNGAAGSDAAGSGPAAGVDPATADALSAMLASAMPGTSFADPLGSIAPITPEPDVSAATQDSDPSATNGSEAMG